MSHDPIIIVIAGKARSGKNTTADLLKTLFEADSKKVILSPYTKYLKRYVEEITGDKIDEDHKPRDLLQQLGVEVIKEKLGKRDLFIARQLDDIDIYSYFFDVIIVPDARFPNEIETLKKSYEHVISIKVKSSLDSDMTIQEKMHITETALDNYDETNFDYIVENESLSSLSENIKKLYEQIKCE